MRTWTVTDRMLREWLQRAHDGTDPDVVLIEAQANGEIVFEEAE